MGPAGKLFCGINFASYSCQDLFSLLYLNFLFCLCNLLLRGFDGSLLVVVILWAQEVDIMEGNASLFCFIDDLLKVKQTDSQDPCEPYEKVDQDDYEALHGRL